MLGASFGRGVGIGGVLIQTALFFFLVAIGVGVVIHYAMKWLDKRNPHTQRITIVSIAFCFAMAYIAEQYFRHCRYHKRPTFCGHCPVHHDGCTLC